MDKFDRNKLLLAYLNPGNTGVYNEIQAINDKLFGKGIFNSQILLVKKNIFN